MNIQYVVYCEDEAQRLFLNAAIPVIFKNIVPSTSIEVDPGFKLSPNTKPRFNQVFINATKLAFRNYKTNLFVLCFDSDSPQQEDFERQRNEWISTINKEIPGHKDKFILAVPVQAIEHWLLYLRHLLKEPAKAKAGTIEKIPKREIKTEIYGTEKYISQTCEPLIKELVSNLSPEILASLRSNSFSFKRFYSDVETFMKK